MDETPPTSQRTRRQRTPGRQYPGASLPRALDALAHFRASGGRISVGTLAVRVGLRETNSDFKRLLSSLTGYGLARFTGGEKSVLELEPDGQVALEEPSDDRDRVLQRTLVRPEVFREAARNFAGHRLPAEAGLAEWLKTAGVASSGAPLAARNFIASADVAGAVEMEGETRILSANLLFDQAGVTNGAAADEAQPERPRPGARAPRSVSPPVTETPPREPPPPRHTPPSRTPLTDVAIRLDVSGWTVDQVVELFERLRKGDED